MIKNPVYLAKCSLCGWLGESANLVRTGKKQQGKFHICPGCGKSKIPFIDCLELKNSRSCLVYFSKERSEYENKTTNR